MTVIEVREFHLKKLDQEYLDLRKMVANPQATDDGDELYKKKVSAIISRTTMLLRFNLACFSPAQAKVNAKNNGAKTIKPEENILEQILTSAMHVEKE